MLIRLKRPIWLLALAVVAAPLTACGSAPPATETPSPASSAGPATAKPAAPSLPTVAPGAGGTAEIELTISGGAHAGSYRAVADDSCESDVANNRFSVTYRSEAAPGGFVALELIVRDAAQAGQDETDDFGLTLAVAGAAGGTSYTIDPGGQRGDGTVLLELMQTDATVDLVATAADGSEVELSILCSAM